MGRRGGTAERLRKVTGLESREAVERQEWSAMRSFQDKVYGGNEAEALEVASNWKGRGRTVWIDGSGIEGEGWER